MGGVETSGEVGQFWSGGREGFGKGAIGEEFFEPQLEVGTGVPQVDNCKKRCFSDKKCPSWSPYSHHFQPLLHRVSLAEKQPE